MNWKNKQHMWRKLQSHQKQQLIQYICSRCHIDDCYSNSFILQTAFSFTSSLACTAKELDLSDLFLFSTIFISVNLFIFSSSIPPKNQWTLYLLFMLILQVTGFYDSFWSILTSLQLKPDNFLTWVYTEGTTSL